MSDRHDKWTRVEPGTVIPAGQPYRVEYPEMLPESLASDQHGILAVDYDGLNLPFKPFQRSNFVETSRWFVDSSWKPPHPCNAPLNIKGEGFNCDKGWGHALPHGNTEAGAIWDGEQSPTDSPEPTR